MVETREELRKYLDPKVLAKITKLDLLARLVVEGFISGLHRSPFHGFSVEFASHREYVPGDDLKHLDWRVYAKTDRHVIKQYEEETNLKATFILDASEWQIGSRLVLARGFCTSIGWTIGLMWLGLALAGTYESRSSSKTASPTASCCRSSRSPSEAAMAEA